MSVVDPTNDQERLEEVTSEEVKRQIPRALRGVAIALPLLLIAVYLEVALAVDGRVLGAVPDLVLVILVTIALCFGPIGGALAGFLAGLAIDVAVQAPLGSSSLVLTPIGWGVGAFAQRRRRVSLQMALLVLVVAAAVGNVGGIAVAAAVEAQPIVWGSSTVSGIAGAMLTLLIGIVVMPVLRRAFGMPEWGNS